MTMRFFDFVLSETRQKTIRVEAESEEAASEIVGELWQTGDEMLHPSDDGVALVKIDSAGDTVRDLLLYCKGGEPVRVVVLCPGRAAARCTVNIRSEDLWESWDDLHEIPLDKKDRYHVYYGNGAALNRIIKNVYGENELIYGTAFICRIEDGRIVDIPDIECERYEKLYKEPAEILVMDELAALIPRSTKDKG